ncbi:MAG: endonuclease domain-containing protein, partial [Bacteroidota bacterium]|nr:endonuclease domain-containing protein [Bacteroidota bacterium]
HNKKSLKQIRKTLRNYSTSAEAVLWTKLNKKQIEGLKFRRQHSIGNCVVDFYCSRLNLVIELDGEVHASYQDIIRDDKRDNYLNNLGIKVLRFENKVVFENPEEIICQVKMVKEKRMK